MSEQDLLEQEKLKTDFFLRSFVLIKRDLMPSKQFLNFMLRNKEEKNKFKVLLKRTEDIGQLLIYKVYKEKSITLNELKKLNVIFDKYITKLQKKLALICYLVDMDEKTTN